MDRTKLRWLLPLLFLPFFQQVVAQTERVETDTARWTWTADAGEEKTFTFEVSRIGKYVVDWGDGETDEYSGGSGLAVAPLHTYAAAGSYKVLIFTELLENFTETALGMNLEMVYVEGGTFQMGATEEQGSDAGDSEKPVRTVKLDSYHIGRYEVTQAQWKAVMGTNPSKFSGSNLPVEQVSWEEAQAFCEKLSALTGKNYVLPTEAQWEYAARGGNKSAGYKYAGSNDLDEVGWYGANSQKSTHPVGMKKANELGIYDMSGNVEEWCSDWHADSYDENDTDNPAGPASGAFRVRRGGSWDGVAWYCRVSYRYFGLPGGRSSGLGFRVALLP
ncbi:MAG: formylglycine-generating enzyme family protein [Bacteroides sp.]|nr:formylglycine-generating enzyme family protein [Ruminococcus flavefaciens]MCM1554441.1 formylglycine-generating enzyme family protein [Bacteroides sp.]